MAKSNTTPAQSSSKTAAKSDADKRAALKEKIAAGEQRQAQRSFADQAKDAADNALGYVRANPLKSVAAVAASALVIGALTRPGRKMGKKVGRKTSRLANVATDAALAYGISLLDTASGAASKGQRKLAKAGDKAGIWASSAADEGANLSDYLIKAARRSGKRAGRTIDDLRSRVRH